MFSYFFPTSTTPATSFDSCATFDEMRPVIASLFAKETALKSAATNEGNKSLAYKKSLIISRLCDEIRQLQVDFNQASQANNVDTVKQSISIFVYALAAALDEVVGGVLAKHRDATMRAVGRKAIDVGTHAAVIVPGAVLGQPIVAVSMAVGSATGATSFITTPIRRSLYNMTGLTPRKKTKSIELLHSLGDIVDKLIKKLELEQASQPVGETLESNYTVKEVIEGLTSQTPSFVEQEAIKSTPRMG